jgi:hypothetical protein
LIAPVSLGLALASVFACGGGSKHAKHGQKNASASSASVSGGSLPMFAHSPAEVDAHLAQQTAGYQLDTIIAGNLSAQTRGPMAGLDEKVQAFYAWQTPVDRGKCYITVLRLGDGASFDRAVTLDGVWGFQSQEGPETDVQHADATFGNAVSMDLGCPQKGGSIKTWMLAYSAPNGLGVGPFVVQTWVKTISERELKDRANHPSPAPK